MANWGSVNFSQLEKLKEQFENLANPEQKKEFFEGATKECASRFLGKVIRKTPVGDNTYANEETGGVYKSGPNKGKAKTKRVVAKQGGTLRRGWTAKTEAEAESGSTPNATTYANGLKVKSDGLTYKVTITNPVHYASYVESGHRQQPGRYVPAIGKRLKRNWVEGQFMMAQSEQELKAEIPSVLNRRLTNYLKNKGGN